MLLPILQRKLWFGQLITRYLSLKRKKIWKTNNPLLIRTEIHGQSPLWRHVFILTCLLPFNVQGYINDPSHSLWVTSILFLLTISPLNQTLRSIDETLDCLTNSLIQNQTLRSIDETLDCLTNYLIQNIRKCTENSVENIHNDLRV